MSGFKVDLLHKDGITPELRTALETAAREANREISRMALKSPDPETLKKILDAGPGEHQDRLFSQAVVKSMDELHDRIQGIVEAHRVAYNATRNQDGKGEVDRFLS